MTIRPEKLRAHVEKLAGDIGERNVFRPGSLEAAADYIGSTWEATGPAFACGHWGPSEPRL